MNTKLTLNVNKNVITRAKSYAASRRISLSKLVENYLKSISEKSSDTLILTPLTKELSGIVKNKANIDFKKEKEDYLISKYLK
jgi:ribosomal protein L4